MTIEETVAANPALTAALIGLLVFILIKLISQPYKQLSAAIDTLSRAISSVQDEIKRGRREAREDREKDRAVVISLSDRVRAQETRCAIIQQLCPRWETHLKDQITLPNQKMKEARRSED